MHRDASFPISFRSCRNLGRELRCRLIKQVALLFHPLNVWVLRIQLLQGPDELVNGDTSTSDRLYNLLHVFATVFPGQDRQDGHVGNHVSILGELLDCLAQCGLCLLEATQVDL